MSEGHAPGDGLASDTSVVQRGLDDARQTLFTAANVPLARIDELLAAVSGPALKAVLEMRIEQIVKHGHTAEADRMRPAGMLIKEAKERAQLASDVLWGERQNLKVCRRRAATAAALLLAFIDRLDFEMELHPKQPEGDE
jgi:hypothetical protein